MTDVTPWALQRRKRNGSPGITDVAEEIHEENSENLVFFP